MIRPSSMRLAVLASFFALPALAVQYEADIVIDTELDLYELEQDGQIDEDTLETLIELLRTGVDLNTATREQLYVLPNVTYAEVDAIIAYREKVGGIRDPVELIQAGVLAETQLVQLAPFLLRLDTPRSLDGELEPISGRVRLLSAWATTDPSAPPGALQARAKGPFGFSAGLLAMTTRHRFGALSYDPGSGSLVAGPPVYGFQLPKAWARFENERFDVLLGTYRLGFGQRLTLDNTTRQTPDGFHADDAFFVDQDLDRACASGTVDPGTGICSSADKSGYETSDFTWRDGFRGLVATLKPTALAEGASLSVTAFGSFQDRDVYQYHLVDRGLCPDPRDTSPDCSAPPIYVRGLDGVVGLDRLTFTTLPDVFQEVAGGANATLQFGKGTRLGLTGYGAMPVWPLRDQVHLDMQDFSRFPDGGPWGAIGLDGATAFGPVNLFAEVTRSFDSVEGRGGDWGALQRTVLAGKKEELELALRYYGRDFDNPYARGISAADTLEGSRARNEAGARLRYLNRAWQQVHVRGMVDAWLWPGDGKAASSAGRANLEASGRVDYVGFKPIQPSVWVTHTNKDLSRNFDFTACYDLSSGDGTEVEDLCSGEAYRLGARVRIEPSKQWVVILQYNHALYDSASYSTQFMQDVRALAEVVARPLPELRLRARSRWLEDDLIDEAGALKTDRGEGSLWSTLDATYAMKKQWRARLRYDNYWWLDARASTLLRPNPEHRFRAELEVSF